MSNNGKPNTIIFDLGGVLLDIKPELTMEYLTARYPTYSQEGLLDWFHKAPAFIQYEKGKISTSDFFRTLRKNMFRGMEEDEIRHAWNLMITGFKKEKIDLLENLHQKKRLYLLSNTNDIHKKLFYGMLQNKFSMSGFEGMFIKEYYSHEIGLRKPQQAIFEYVIRESNLIPAETLFVDDSPANINTAKAMGFNTMIHPRNAPLNDIYHLI